jgi:hypothetical protein
VQRTQVVAVVRGPDRDGQDGAGDVPEVSGGVVTFQRGDIVRLRLDEIEATTIHSAEFRDATLARTYIVLEPDDAAFFFTMPTGETVGRHARWIVWPTRSRHGLDASCLLVSEADMIPTGERAEEVK